MHENDGVQIFHGADDAESISNTSFVFKNSKPPIGLLIIKKEALKSIPK